MVRLRGAGTVDPALDRCLREFALLSTVLLNISSRTCNRPHHQFPERTVIRPEFRRERANLSVVKERLTLIPSGGPTLAGPLSLRRAWTGLAFNGQKQPIKSKNPALSAGQSSEGFGTVREAQASLSRANKAPHYRIR